MNKLSESELRLINHHDPNVRFDILLKISSSEEMILAHLNEIIGFLDDSFDNHKRGSEFGPSNIDPDKDLPIALHARNIIEMLGLSHREIVITSLLQILSTFRNEPCQFYAVQILGKLKAKEAIPLFRKFTLEGTTLHVRVNFDQVDYFYLGKAAAISYYQTDYEGFKEYVYSLLDGSYFANNPSNIFDKNTAKNNEEFWKKLLTS